MKNILLLAGFLFSLNSLAQLPSYVPANAIVAFWPFNGNANDASGNGNNGTVYNATLTTDRFGGGNGAYYFSNTTAVGSDTSYIQTAVNNVNSISTSGAMTLSFWINRVGNGNQGSRVMEWGSCTTCAGQI